MVSLLRPEASSAVAVQSRCWAACCWVKARLAAPGSARLSGPVGWHGDVGPAVRCCGLFRSSRGFSTFCVRSCSGGTFLHARQEW